MTFLNLLKKKLNFIFFENCFKIIIDIYDNHCDYIEKDISITRVLAWWCKNNVINELIVLKDFDNIKKEYKKHFNYINVEFQIQI